MKFKFESNQAHQQEAWESAISVFEGQEIFKATFAMPSIKASEFEATLTRQNDKGFGNDLRLPPDEILKNIQHTQLKNGLKQSDNLDSLDFTIEMETGTGKTYVYLRSIYEMNKLYGFTKFIIVVPSIAVKEGVHKFLKMTETHLKRLYNNTPCDYFIYNSNRLEQVKNFAENDYIQIMIINIDAFRKSFSDPSKEDKANIIHRWNDKMQGVPIEFVKSTNPIVIIDEPQSVDTTDKSAEAIKSLNPLCSFRYSATHIDKHNMLYKLDSIDAYEKKLVKQIAVASTEVQDDHNEAYIKLLSVDNKNGFRAKIELDIRQVHGIERKEKWVKPNADLHVISNGRSIYEGYIINDIYCEEGNEYIDFTSQPDIIRLNQVIGDNYEYEYKRKQIQKTIEEHLDKEIRLTPLGIKVLSLFFIDKVSNYRDYEAPEQKGKFALMFEEEYAELIKKPKYKELDKGHSPAEVHGGYFSKDKKNKDTVKDTSGKTAADDDTYQLIMRDKEKLLSFDTKLKFIFSHSALKEGWDNPNVFQICTLNETKSILKRRQEIGRGMRIAVNQDGERIHGFSVNTLTVLVNESYKDFVDGLQSEIEDEENIKFGRVEKHSFANIRTQDEHDNDVYLGIANSEKIWDYILGKNYIDKGGRVTEELKEAIRKKSLEIPPEYEKQSDSITAILKKIALGLKIKNSLSRQSIKLNKEIFESKEFKELWDRIKFKTIYNVNFSPLDLIDRCAKEIKNLTIGQAKIKYSKAKTEITQAGVMATSVEEKTYLIEEQDYPVPDILGVLQNETNLKRQSILDILLKSGRLSDFKKNPQQFIDKVRELIKQEMRHFIVDGIKYEKISNTEFYQQECFEQKELIGYIENMMEAKKSVYEHVAYDSDIESTLAENFESADEVKVYAKLPRWFTIDTPLGNYNPDWAVLFEIDGQKKLYFVVESKGTISKHKLRGEENDKIECAREHFAALGKEADYIVADNYDRIYDEAVKLNES